MTATVASGVNRTVGKTRGAKRKGEPYNGRRQYLTEAEIEKLMGAARKHGRYGFRDATMVLLCYRHGLRASELCRLQWHDIDWERGLLRVRRVKNGTSTDHPLTGRELRALRKVKAEQAPSRYVFMTERGAPMSPDGFYKLITRLGAVTKLEFELHPHMLRHACGYKLANDGQDTRAIQHYLGHKDIRHTCRYTDLSPTRFTGFWRN
jgi:integrase